MSDLNASYNRAKKREEFDKKLKYLEGGGGRKGGWKNMVTFNRATKQNEKKRQKIITYVLQLVRRFPSNVGPSNAGGYNAGGSNCDIA